KAHELKLSFELLKDHQSKSTILSTSLESIDVFSYIDAENYAYVNYLRIIKGAVNQVYTVQITKKTDESKSEIFSSTIFEIRNMVGSMSKTIIVPFVPEFQLNNVNYIVPKKGDKKQLLELSLRNANFFKLDKDRDRSNKTKAYSTMNTLLSIKKDLKLPTLPHRIECFDNSNIQGTNPVASCVVFIDGKPAKREYRKFHIKTVVGADDFASMEEIIYRRYKRRLDENAELPDLIVVDGGKGQLHAALNSLEKLNLLTKVPIVGLAKQMEEIYYPGDSNPYILAKTSITLKVLMFARDEAHRFGITFHRSLRELKFIDTELQNIDNIGPSTIQKLMEKFKSVHNVKNATLQELSSCINLVRAKAIYKYFHKD
ncbi:MAG: excinuclease ABC subunit C, partial [Bacilli bacterium]